MLLRNTIWNLLGEGLPMLAALISIPLLVGGVGLERFGALTFVWALLGVLSILDMGLVRTLTQLVAERRGRDPTDSAAGIATPAIWMMAGVGVVAGLIVALAAGPIAERFMDASGEVEAEIREGLKVAAFIVPVALISAGFRGILEAHQRFRAINIVRMSVGVANYLSPLLALPFSDSLVPVLLAIAVGRVVGMLAFGWLALERIPDLLWPIRRRGESLRPLFSMGVWMTLNNLLGPAMLYADRFVLAGAIPAAAIAFYTTPFEVMIRLLFIPTALAGVLFPTVAEVFRRDPGAPGRMLAAGGGAVLAVFALALIAVAAAGEAALGLWLGPEFALNSAPVARVLMLGVLLNAVAFVPYALIQGVGRVDVTARLQLVELPIYLVVLWLLVREYGPMGAAMAWSLRTGCDLFALLALLPRLAPGTGNAAARLAANVLAVVISAVAGLSIGGIWGLSILAAGAGGVLVLNSRDLIRAGGGMAGLPRRVFTAIPRQRHRGVAE